MIIFYINRYYLKFLLHFSTTITLIVNQKIFSINGTGLVQTNHVILNEVFGLHRFSVLFQAFNPHIYAPDA